jgi:putative ABC transport system ATP-binding protein
MLSRRKKVGIEHNGAHDGIVAAMDVVKTYDMGSTKVEALKGINFAVQRGEMVGVMGPSGCGKTTLLNCLSGLDDVSSGVVTIEGENIADMGDKKRTTYRAKRMGFIFQVYNLLPVLSAVENVELPLLVANVRPGDARKKAMAALERVGLAQWADHRPAELSGGQRQRVTIARSLVNEPAIVWADEPTGALDSTSASDIMQLLKQLNQEQGLTIVLVTHDHGVGNMWARISRKAVAPLSPRTPIFLVRLCARHPSLGRGEFHNARVIWNIDEQHHDCDAGAIAAQPCSRNLGSSATPGVFSHGHAQYPTSQDAKLAHYRWPHAGHAH